MNGSLKTNYKRPWMGDASLRAIVAGNMVEKTMDDKNGFVALGLNNLDLMVPSDMVVDGGRYSLLSHTDVSGNTTFRVMSDNSSTYRFHHSDRGGLARLLIPHRDPILSKVGNFGKTEARVQKIEGGLLFTVAHEDMKTLRQRRASQLVPFELVAPSSIKDVPLGHLVCELNERVDRVYGLTLSVNENRLKAAVLVEYE